MLAAGKEFVDALAQAQAESGNSVFMEALKEYAADATGVVGGLLKEVVQLCERM